VADDGSGDPAIVAGFRTLPLGTRMISGRTAHSSLASLKATDGPWSGASLVPKSSLELPACVRVFRRKCQISQAQLYTTPLRDLSGELGYPGTLQMH
jgi:hypothetical protein